MNNPKTSIAGILILAAAVLKLAASILTGTLSTDDITAVMAGLAGLGLVMAKDGGR